MTPQEYRVMDNLVIAVDFLLSDTPRSGRHNEIKAIRESLRDANADLNPVCSNPATQDVNAGNNNDCPNCGLIHP